MFNNKDFFPTPKDLIRKMFHKIGDLREYKSILEPSAGRGDIVEEIYRYKNMYVYRQENKNKFDIDCIEIQSELRYILQGKGYRVVHDDFLTYEGFKKYDLIIANFPFSEGDKHLLKALELIKNGGTMVSIINAQTLKNAYSNTRNDLINKLKEYNADVEFIQDSFISAERKTNVEIALITVKIENNNNSFIVDRLKQEEKQRQETNRTKQNEVIDGDFIKGIIQQYNFELKAGLKLIDEYFSLQPYLLKSFKKDSNSTILRITTKNESCYTQSKNDRDLKNDFIKQVRSKYWTALFTNEQFTSKLTSNLLEQYRAKISELEEYDFSYFNIKEVQHQMSIQMVQGVKDTIIKLFDEITYKHSYHSETSKNKLHYNGWKTNKAHKVNKKVIIIKNGYADLTKSSFKEKIKDIEHVFNYLDEGNTPEVDLFTILENAQQKYQTKNIMTKYFKIDTYMKGTTHITFLDQELLKKFNIYCGKHKNFLPPDYGNKEYSNLNNEYKRVVNEFEGQKEYKRTVEKKEYYLYNPEKTLLLTV